MPPTVFFNGFRVQVSTSIQGAAAVSALTLLTRDETTEPVARGQTLRRGRRQENIIFPVQVITSRIGTHIGWCPAF